jgi:predicted Fe-Mo cluster-binding NifX family protein
MQTKVAIATEDGIKISAHFGRAPYYQVVTVEDGKVVASEKREKAHHQTGQHQEHGHDGHMHGDMISAASGCEAVIAGGMGNGAFTSIRSAGLKPIITDEHDIERAALAYAAGTLVNRTERLH